MARRPSRSGAVDAWSGLDPLLSTSVANGASKIIYDNIDFNSYGFLNATESFLEKSPDLAQLVVNAYEKARAFAIADPEKTAEILAGVAAIDLAIATAVISDRSNLEVDPVPGEAQREVLAIIGPIFVESGDVPEPAADRRRARLPAGAEVRRGSRSGCPLAPIPARWRCPPRAPPPRRTQRQSRRATRCRRRPQSITDAAEASARAPRAPLVGHRRRRSHPGRALHDLVDRLQLGRDAVVPPAVAAAGVGGRGRPRSHPVSSIATSLSRRSGCSPASSSARSSASCVGSLVGLSRNASILLSPMIGALRAVPVARLGAAARALPRHRRAVEDRADHDRRRLPGLHDALDRAPARRPAPGRARPRLRPRSALAAARPFSCPRCSRRW